MLVEKVFTTVLVEQQERLQAKRELKELDDKRKGKEVEPVKESKVASKPVKSDGKYA